MKRALLALLLCGCGQLLPAEPDAGHAKVPGSYHDVRLSPGHRAHLALEGDKQLACRDCHFITDAGFSAAAVKGCGECHTRQLQHHHPFDGGVAMTCFSCHAFRGTSTEKWGCAGCHVKDKPGAPQVTVHTEKCESCHRPHGTPFTRAADCGQCHDLTVSHGKGEKALVADTCMACHPHHTAAKVAQPRCIGCHAENAKGLFEEGPVADRTGKKGHPRCSSCHPPHAFTAAQVKGCSSCHTEEPVLAPDKHVACATCHVPHDPRAAPKSCESCHQKLKVAHPKTDGHSCTGCHPPHAESSRAQLAVPCVTCHQQLGPVAHAKSTFCRSCHLEPHAGKPAREGLCVTCHEKQLTLTKSNKGHQSCDACHAGLPHGQPVPPKPCLSCHEKKQPPQQGHAACESCHQSHSAKVLKKCTDCHAQLPGLHQVAKHQKCSSCHAPHVPEPGFGPAACRTCHVQLPTKSHPTPPQQCASCHLFKK
jgi:hypothetical protein